MANADEFCQFARLGQTVKIQKCLQSRRVDVNALNLLGESALSTATCHNQILCVEYLLANRADPKLRLAAGHTAVHIACRLGNVPILHMLLSIKKETRDDDDDETSQQQRDDKHLFDCLRMKDHSNLTPVHWAATQESVSKRQKMFAYLDRRMPGVLDSRYNLDWFTSWARIHSWVLERKATNLPIRPVLRTSDRVYGDDESADIESLDMTPRFSNNDYERTPRAPLTATTAVDQYNNTFQETPHQPSKLRTPRVQIEHPTPALPNTPMTSCKVTVTSTYQMSKHDRKHRSPLKFAEHQQSPRVQRQSFIDDQAVGLSQKTPTSTTIINEQAVTSLSDRFTYRARRVPIEPTIEFPPPPPLDEEDEEEEEDYDDVTSTSSSKRPSHNLLSNIVPSATTPSTDRSSQPSTKQFASSFGFDTLIEPHRAADTDTYERGDDDDDNEQQIESELSISSDDDDHNPLDYLCKSTSTLGAPSPGAHIYYA